jgi:hypothetical protein
MLKHTELINSLIKQRQLQTGAVFDRKTYWNASSYRKVAETRDLRYDYAFSIMKKWTGGTVEEWVSKMPVEFEGHVLDYGRGSNKMTSQFRDLDPEIIYEYDYFHTVNADHILPKSYGGKFEYDNCIIRPKVANIIRQNFNDVTLREALLITAKSYGISLAD